MVNFRSIIVPVAAIVALSLSLDASARRSSFEDDDFGTARSLREVGVIRIDANQCGGGISSALRDRGIGTTRQADEADAVLVVDVRHTGRNLDNLPSFGGIGDRANYEATLHGLNGRVLFSTAGSEGSYDMSELCGDIGDQIGDRLKNRG